MTMQSSAAQPVTVIAAGDLNAAHLGRVLAVPLDGRTVIARLISVEHEYRMLSSEPVTRLRLRTIPSESWLSTHLDPELSVEVHDGKP